MISIYKKPGEGPKIVDVENTLEALQRHVEGYIETVTIAQDAVIIVNDEGRINGMPFNFWFCGMDLYGPALIVGRDGDEFTDLAAGARKLIMNALSDPGYEGGAG